MKRRILTSEEALQDAVQTNRINKKDSELVFEFIRKYGIKEDLSEGSKKKYFYALRAVLENIHSQKATIPTLTEDNVLNLKEYIKKSEWSEETQADYWTRFRVFYKWIEKRHGPWEGPAKELIKGEDAIKWKIDRNKVEKKGILTPEEVLKLVHTEPETAYRAFFSVLYESGMRAGEAFSLLIRDVEKIDQGYILHIRRSKTKKRDVFVITYATKRLYHWLKSHPNKDNLDSPLFLNALGEPLANAAANKRLKWLLRAAQIQRKKVTLHSFRHSRASELANAGWNNSQLCKMFGWSSTSKMPATYIRESAVDIKSAICKTYGLEQEQKHEVKGIHCNQCQCINHSEAEMCDNCGMPLDPWKLAEIKDKAKGEPSNAEQLIMQATEQVGQQLLERIAFLEKRLDNMKEAKE